MARLDEAAGTANTKVLLHPAKAPVVVRSSHQVATAVLELDGRLGIERGHDAVTTRRWVEAATDVKDNALETGANRVDAAKRRGNESFHRARSVKSKLSNRVAEQIRLRRDIVEDTPEEHV